MSQPTDIHTLAGAYTLDAVDDLERAAFTRHLTGCPACAQEVAELAETVAHLAEETAVPSPPGLRARVLREAARTPQVGPPPAVQAGQAAIVQSDRAPAARTRRPTRWRPWVAGIVAASVIAAGAAATTYAVQDHRVRQAERIQAVLTAPDAVTLTAPARGGGQVSMVLSPARDAAVVVLSGLTTPDRAHAYQLWLIRGGRPASAGVLTAGHAGGARYIDRVRGADLLGLTLEPAGGLPDRRSPSSPRCHYADRPGSDVRVGAPVANPASRSDPGAPVRTRTA
ncbi:MAG TPA: anti-sigma factor [Asanoa sp.]